LSEFQISIYFLQSESLDNKIISPCLLIHKSDRFVSENISDALPGYREKISHLDKFYSTNQLITPLIHKWNFLESFSGILFKFIR